MESFIKLFTFIKSVFVISLSQFLTLFAVFFFFGLLLYLLARFTRVVFVKSIGTKFDIYITGWIGTPVHEIGHAVFCIIFGHKIVDMKLFHPNNSDGSLGYVNHSYNSRNPWHQIGNFFIGFGPIILGSIIIMILSIYLIPNNDFLSHFSNSKTFDLKTLTGIKDQFIQLVNSGKHVSHSLFVQENLQSWEFWLFIYLTVCVASHMELSPPDIKGLLSGLIYIFILFFVINTVGQILNINMSTYLLSINKYSHWLVDSFSIASICSSMFFVFSFIILNIYTLIRYQRFFQPIA